jgi:hypothetical protein
MFVLLREHYMPIVGLRINNKEMSFKDALRYALKSSYMSHTYLLYLYQQSLNPHHFPSVTVLNNCPRSLWIQKNCDIFVDFHSQYPLFQGTMTHSLLENVNLGDNFLKEYTMKIKLGSHELSGTCDLYNKKAKQLVDYKTIKKIIFKKEKNKLVPLYLHKEDYVNQLHIYALGLEQNGYAVKSMAIEYFPKEGCVVQEKAYSETQYTNIPAMPYRIKIEYNRELQKELETKYTKRLDWLMDDTQACPSWEDNYETGKHAWQCYKLNPNGCIASSYCVAAHQCKKIHEEETTKGVKPLDRGEQLQQLEMECFG